jgi:hypothetical protein
MTGIVEFLEARIAEDEAVLVDADRKGADEDIHDLGVTTMGLSLRTTASG